MLVGSLGCGKIPPVLGQNYMHVLPMFVPRYFVAYFLDRADQRAPDSLSRSIYIKIKVYTMMNSDPRRLPRMGPDRTRTFSLARALTASGH